MLGIHDYNLTYPCKHVLVVLSIYVTVRKLLENGNFELKRMQLFERLIRRFTLSNM